MDLFTVVIYILFSFLNMFMLRTSVTYKENHNRKYAGIINFIVIFYMTIFAAGRYVSEDGIIGGADARAYIMRFENANDYFSNFNFFGFLSLRNEEPFYALLTLGIRFCTSNYHVYFAFIYGIISICFVYFVYNMYDRDSNWLSVILLTLYYIYSFNVMRTMLAAALCSVAVVKAKKNNWIMSVVFSILAFFSHYTAIIFLPVIVVSFLYRKKPYKVKTYKLLVAVACCNVATYMAFSVIEHIFLSTRYYTYFLVQPEFSILGWIPVIFLNIISILFSSDFTEHNNINYLCIIAMGLNCSLMYIMVARSGWRMNDYFCLIRMFIFSEFYHVTERRFEKWTSSKMLKIAVNVFIVMIYFQFLFSLKADYVYPYIFGNMKIY